jgi:hypothetical protein
VRVELEEPDVLLVAFDVGGELLGVRYSLADMSEGPQTGLPCESAEEWAGDLWGDIDEQIATGAGTWAERLARPDGVTLLRWWPGSSDVRP